MSELWYISDSHFGHASILSFTNRTTGFKVRPEFSSVEEMNETMISAWNSVVKPEDKIYHLGDFCFVQDFVQFVSRLNGHKRLILGNHDRVTAKHFQYFEKISESMQMNDVVFSHRPIFLNDADEIRVKYNVHGHIHERVIPDDRYLNISVEQTNYRPLNLDEIKSIFKFRGLEPSF